MTDNSAQGILSIFVSIMKVNNPKSRREDEEKKGKGEEIALETT